MVVFLLHTESVSGSSPLSTTKLNGAIVYRLGHLVFIQASGVRFPVALPKISRQSPNANPVGDELTRLCRCSQYIVGAVPTGNRIQLLLSLK